MARPLKTDRDTVATDTLTLRLTPADRATLDSLVAAKAAELASMGVEITAAAYVRGLIRQEANRVHGLAPNPATPSSHPPAPLVERRATPRPAAPDENQTRALLDRVLNKGIGIRKSDVCKLSGVDAGQLSKWIARAKGLSDIKLRQLASALEVLDQRPGMRVATAEELAEEKRRFDAAAKRAW
jgi:hypothetical protein